MENNFEKILVTNQEINAKVEELAKQINQFYKNKENVLIVPIMDGSLVFAGNLLLNFDFDLILKSTRISLYNNNDQIDKNKINNINIDFDSKIIEGKDILVIDDLIDTGNTLNLFQKYLFKQKAKSVNICVLFKKMIDPRDVEVDIKWYGFEVPNQWIAGYGIDSKLKYRNFKHLGIIKK